MVSHCPCDGVVPHVETQLSHVRIQMGWFHDCESAPTMWVISHRRGRLTHVQTRRKHLVSGASTASQGTQLNVNTQPNTIPAGTALTVNSVNTHIRLQCQGSSYRALQHTQANAISTLKVIQNTLNLLQIEGFCDKEL